MVALLDLPDFYKTVHDITLDLIKTPSIVATQGEGRIALKIMNILKASPYFQKHPDNLWLVDVPGGPWPKYTVMALVEGEKNRSSQTVVLLGHIDTVRVEDFGTLKYYAFNPKGLVRHFSSLNIGGDVKEDLDSGKYMFGRGSVDMKSGVAAHMAVLMYLSEIAEGFSGNVLLAATPDEEDMSSGAIAALDELFRLKKERGFEYIALINADYTSPLYPGDDHRYVYLGTVGKLLPSFFIAGRETHVGQCFEGFDPNLLAAELTRLFDMNTDLCDEVEGEVTLPPVSLKQRDLKELYDVQIPFAAQCYYNFFTHSRSPEDIMKLCKEIARKAFVNVITTMEQKRRHYYDKANMPYHPVPYEPLVYSYHEFYQKVISKHPELISNLETLNENLLQDPNIDLREHSLRVVEEVWKQSEEFNNRIPLIIVYFSSAFNARVHIKGEKPSEVRLMDAVKKTVGEITQKTSENISIRKFFPYISDMSIFGISDTPEEIEVLKCNMPAWGKKYFLDTEKIRAINIPMVNIGPYGKDAHKMFERVEMNYSFRIVPQLIFMCISNLLL
ncbi:M20/M25/M40 family metallo-hydrolase [Biomaibacter acetigenes]|uniref:M20/M25/M40 family metallo-hydrolase n=1 Tax=Biomaibacter acetigenes TaxID=2316383 RepID=A0A3G2R926_9FIRM|nr:M20/M25/M40 family metallo-hydrolase [Biomaibacter acetigenes]AYO31267.1 M20/M25/M40 family metallo-hydrolase [Biomaibacter acetigenes]